MVHNICEQHSIANRFLAHLRDVHTQGTPAIFRANMKRLGSIFAYEISKTFAYDKVQTETPFGVAQSYLPAEEIVLVTIMRAGLPLHEGMLEFLGPVGNGFLATQRLHHKDGTFEIEVDYINCPEVEGKTVILTDAMLATGSSAVASLDAITEIGQPARIHVATLIGTKSGARYLNRMYPEAELWVAAMDEELTAKSYIVPGLGDAGDLAYGGKRET